MHYRKYPILSKLLFFKELLFLQISCKFMIRPYQAKNNSQVIYHITQDVPGYYNLSDNKQVIVHIAKLGSLLVKLKTTLVERKKTCFKVEYLLFLWHTSLEIHLRILTFLKCWMILCYKLKTVHVALKSSHVWLLSVVSGDKTINLDHMIQQKWRQYYLKVRSDYPIPY